MAEKIEHSDQLDWPNGLGWTPCSREYRETLDKRDALYDQNSNEGTLEDLPPDEWNEWMRLDYRLGELQLAGHLGRSEKY